MLNFGPEAMFSRVIPIFNEPQHEGDWAERSMLKYGDASRTFSRPKPAKTASVNAAFFPEGGRLVRNVPSRVAFELSDKVRRPLTAISGRIVDVKADTIVASFDSGHMGRGAFSFTPRSEKYRADFEVNGKKYSVSLPAVEKQGITLNVDNLTAADSVNITVARSDGFPARMVGASLTCRGELYSRAILDLSDDTSASFKVARRKLPTGVIQLTLFDPAGNILTDRLFFNNRKDMTSIDYQFDKPAYDPFEPVNLEVKLSRPVPFSLSVADADSHVAYGSNLLADLLLASEIRGYVHNPAYYFEDGAETDLDNLLLIQGWRKYPWTQLAGLEPYDIKTMPEQGIEIHGRVLGQLSDKPQRDVTVSAIFNKTGWKVREILSDIYDLEYITDSLGRFAYRTDFTGQQMVTLSTSKKDKRKKYRIFMNNIETPAIREYDRGEMRYLLQKDKNSLTHLPEDSADDYDDYNPADDPANKDTHLLREVEVTAERGHAKDLRQYIENSVASYDISSARGSLYDQGTKHIRKIRDILPQINPNFTYDTTAVLYRGKRPLYVIDKEMGKNGKMSRVLDLNTFDPSELSIDLVKSIHINEQPQAIAEYAVEYFVNRAELMQDADLFTDKNGVKKGGHGISAARDERNRDFHSMTYKLEAYNRFSCVVLIELNAGFHNMIRPGLRRAIINGYTEPIEFYAPNYSEMPVIESDYRRTLYWNPDVRPDSDGTARIRFFNNSTATGFNVTSAHLPQF